MVELMTERLADLVKRNIMRSEPQRELPRHPCECAFVLSSTVRNSALSLRSDRDVGDKGCASSRLAFDLGQGHRLTRSVGT